MPNVERQPVNPPTSWKSYPAGEPIKRGDAVVLGNDGKAYRARSKLPGL